MTRREDIDALKGIAILAVVLFHMGLLKTGYLGVDVFLVINGFFIVPAVCKQWDDGHFKYLEFLRKRISRLLPLVVLASTVCLVAGYVLMLPESYKYLSESVVGSNLMSENILQILTTKNYWNVANVFNPLMHLWFIGILVEFYLIFPLLLWLYRTVIGFIGWKCQTINCLYIIFAISFILWILPYSSEAAKFYCIQYRLFELIAGGIVGCYVQRQNRQDDNSNLLFIGLLVFTLFCGLLSFDTGSMGLPPVIADEILVDNDEWLTMRSTFLLLVVVATSVVIIRPQVNSKLLNSRVLIAIGKRSYSIFIWHQVLLAFWRYSVTIKVSFLFVVGFIIVLFLVSELTYRFIENKNLNSFIIWGTVSLFVSIIAGCIYLNYGVVKNVPELDVRFDRTTTDNLAYVDRAYAYDLDFPEYNGKVNVLIEGISFGRDLTNALLESEYSDLVNISYVFSWSEEHIDRIRNADAIFTLSAKSAVPLYVWENCKNSVRIYGLGTKNYGACMGNIYSRRYLDDYYQMTICPDERYLALNNRWREEWGQDNYLDLMSLAMTDDGMLRVFTPDGKYISWDCSHWTKAGAQWYGSIIQWSQYLGM